MQYFLHFQCHSTNHAVYNSVTLLGGKNLQIILRTALCSQKDVRRKEHEQTQRWYKKGKKETEIVSQNRKVSTLQGKSEQNVGE